MLRLPIDFFLAGSPLASVGAKSQPGTIAGATLLSSASPSHRGLSRSCRNIRLPIAHEMGTSDRFIWLAW